MTTAATLKRIQVVRNDANQEDEQSARSSQQSAIAKARTKIDTTYDARIEAADQRLEAAQEKSFWSTLGTIVLGPIVGSLVGMGIGALDSNGNNDAATKADEAAGIADVQRTKATDELADATENIEDVAQSTEHLEKFMRDLRRQDGEDTNML